MMVNGWTTWIIDGPRDSLPCLLHGGLAETVETTGYALPHVAAGWANH